MEEHRSDSFWLGLAKDESWNELLVPAIKDKIEQWRNVLEMSVGEDVLKAQGALMALRDVLNTPQAVSNLKLIEEQRAAENKERMDEFYARRRSAV